MNLPLATEAVLEALRERRKGYVCVTGVHGVSEAQDDPAFRRILNAAFLNTTDGMPLVWLGRRALAAPVDRVYGPDLMLEIFRATQQTGYPPFLLRRRARRGRGTASALEARFPGCDYRGHLLPAFPPARLPAKKRSSSRSSATGGPTSSGSG